MNDSAIKNKSSLFTLFFSVIFLDFLIFAGIIPLIPLLILEPQNSILPYDLPLNVRCILLGTLYSVYPLAQMLFSPLLGAFSDKYNRKTLLLTAYCGNTIGYLLFATGIYYRALPLLILGFFIAGATGCNISTTNTIISDLSLKTEKLKRFSLSNMMMGLAFILGPFLAGKLVDAFPNEVPYLSFIAFLVCGAVSIGNILLIARFYKLPFIPVVKKQPSLSFNTVFREEKPLIFVLGGAFLLFFGWYAFIKFFQALFLNHPSFQDLEIFNALSYFGIMCVLSQFCFSLFLHKIFNRRKHLIFFIALLAISIFATAFVKSYLALMTTVTLFSFAYSILCPCLMYEISEFGTQETRGRIMGIYQSVQDLAKILAPILAGCTMAISTQGPILIASSFILGSFALFYAYTRTKLEKNAPNRI